MNTSKRTNPDFLNGVPELLLLRLLARQPMYGYELVQRIRLQSDSALEFGEGCIYPILHRLERIIGCKAHVQGEAARPGDQRYTFADTSRLTRQLGWQPRVGLDEGLARQVAWQRGLALRQAA